MQCNGDSARWRVSGGGGGGGQGRRYQSEGKDSIASRARDDTKCVCRHADSDHSR